MRFKSYDLILQDFLFFKEVISALDEAYFPYMTPQEIVEEKRLLLQECRMDYAFKMLTYLEAVIRQDFDQTIASKFRDPLSKKYSELCDQFRKEKNAYSRSRREVCKRIALSDIIKTIADHFRNHQDRFHERCSLLKGHFRAFRHWYAHGRFFRPNPPLPPEPEELSFICEELSEKVLSRSHRALQA